MVLPVLVVVFVILIFYRCYKYCFYRPANFPPGPPRLPLLGSYLHILLINHKFKHFAINKLCEYYKSTVIGFYTGDFVTVFANDSKSVREMLFKPEFDGRHDVLLSRLREPNFKRKGVFFIDGGFWLQQRRFTLRNLRDFGFGRRYQEYEVEVIDEMKSLVNLIKEGPKYEHEKKYFKSGGAVCLPKALIGAMGNCFLQVCAGERLARADQANLFRAGEATFKFLRNGNEYGNVFGIVPWVRILFPETSSYKQCRESSMILMEFMKEIIDKQIATYQPGHVRHFMDVYIKEIKDAEASGEKTGYDYDQMLMTCIDFLFPAISAIQAQVAYLLRFLIYNQNVAQKIQDEIELVVGSGRLPELDDRINLPYTEATLREILRFETQIPSSVAHRTTENTTLAGYDIPKDAFALAGLHTLHNEEDLWKDPKNFRPERFLDFREKLSVKKDVSLPFGAGRRLCAGETFARNTMFLCIAALLQNFNVKPDEAKIPRLDDNYCGISVVPNDFWVKLEAR